MYQVFCSAMCTKHRPPCAPLGNWATHNQKNYALHTSIDQAMWILTQCSIVLVTFLKPISILIGILRDIIQGLRWGMGIIKRHCLLFQVLLSFHSISYEQAVLRSKSKTQKRREGHFHNIAVRFTRMFSLVRCTRMFREHSRK